jgi:hypothetical protein
VARRTCQPIAGPDRDHLKVAAAGICQQLIECGTTDSGAADCLFR